MNTIQNLYQVLPQLNNPNAPFYYEIKGDEIVGRWNWMDARFFTPNGVSEETKEYAFRVRIDSKGKWHESEQTHNTAKNVDIRNGKITFGSDNFTGATTSKQFEFGFGKNKQNGQTGAIGFYLDTNMIKQPVRDLLKAYGYRKAIF